ncbi:MAG TPA: hypothetical protein VE690_09145 [Rhodopila sp.]|nr:hypothetical protein [Rhodopila sp.]
MKARSIGRERADRDKETPRLRETHVTAPVMLLGKEVRLLPTEEGELRAADGDQPADPAGVRPLTPGKAGALTL